MDMKVPHPKVEARNTNTEKRTHQIHLKPDQPATRFAYSRNQDKPSSQHAPFRNHKQPSKLSLTTKGSPSNPPHLPPHSSHLKTPTPENGPATHNRPVKELQWCRMNATGLEPVPDTLPFSAFWTSQCQKLPKKQRSSPQTSTSTKIQPREEHQKKNHPT